MAQLSSSPPPRFKITFQGKAQWLSPGQYTLGRSELCKIILDDSRASRCHARLIAEDVLTIEDLKSANGTFLNGARLLSETPHPLRDGDRIVIGAAELVVGAGSAPSSRPAGFMELRGASSLPVSSGGPETMRADPLQLLGEVGQRALSAGHPADAARLVGPQVERVTAEIRRGGTVSGAQVDWAVGWALKLAKATGQGVWLDAAFTLWRESGRLPSSVEHVAAVETLAESVDRVDLRGFVALLDRFRTAPRAPGSDALTRRVEALLGKVANRAGQAP